MPDAPRSRSHWLQHPRPDAGAERAAGRKGYATREEPVTRHAITVAARSGYAARGVVYLLVGGLALMASLGAGGKATGTTGALASLVDNGPGLAVLAGIGAGLLGFALWRAIQGLLDADRHGRGAKGIVLRAALLVSAVTYGGLALYALTLIVAYVGDGSGSGGAAAWLLGQPYGRYVVGLVALCMLAAGAAQAWKGLSGRYRERLELNGALALTLRPLCVIGLVARGVVFGLVGGLLLYAALHVDPSEAGGLDKALGWLQEQVYGGIMLAAIAIGLIAFALYSLIEARWRRIGAPRALSR